MIEPREALWTPTTKASLKPGDIVRFTYAAQYPSTEYVVGKVSEVDHSDYCIYFEQQPEELQAFSRTAAAPIIYDPSATRETIDLYLAPNGVTASFRNLYANGLRYLAKDTPTGFCWAYSDKPYQIDLGPQWVGSDPEIVDSQNPVSGLVDARADEPLCISSYCRFAYLVPEELEVQEK